MPKKKKKRTCKWPGFIGNEGRDDPENVMFIRSNVVKLSDKLFDLTAGVYLNFYNNCIGAAISM